MTYKLIDSGEQRKLEQYGNFVLDRPDPQAIWTKGLRASEWGNADARFEKSWKTNSQIPDKWIAEIGNYNFEISLKNFKHTGVFPEHLENWAFIENCLKIVNSKFKILNLFGYTGGATLAAAKSGAEVVHVDASKPAILAAKQNAKLNNLEDAKIRWIEDDAKKFVEREVRRGIKYDGIIMDPPVFGRGAKGEIWKIEENLLPLLQSIKKILSDNYKFILLNGYASGYTPLAYGQLLASVFDLDLEGVESGELCITESSKRAFSLPAGIFARYSRK